MNALYYAVIKGGQANATRSDYRVVIDIFDSTDTIVASDVAVNIDKSVRNPFYIIESIKQVLCAREKSDAGTLAGLLSAYIGKRIEM